MLVFGCVVRVWHRISWVFTTTGLAALTSQLTLPDTADSSRCMDSGITAPSPLSSVSQGVCAPVQDVSPYLTYLRVRVSVIFNNTDHGQAFRRLESVLLYGFMHIYLFLGVAFFTRSFFIFSLDKHYSGAGNAIILCIFAFSYRKCSISVYCDPHNSCNTRTILMCSNYILFFIIFFNWG